MKRAKVPGTPARDGVGVKVGPIASELLRAQRRAFEAQFGRQAAASDPVFFNPDAAVPEEMTDEQMLGFVTGMFEGLGLTSENAKVAVSEWNGMRFDEMLLRAFRRAGRKAWS